MLLLTLLLAFASDMHPQDLVETLGPAAWADAPAPVVDALNEAGCRIPQPVNATGKANLIRGRFAHSYQQDWAALCIDDAEHAHIEVVWTGDMLCPSLAPTPVDLQHASIATASPKLMHKYETLYGVNDRAPLATHDGIEFSAAGQQSIVYFCVNGEWAERQGRSSSNN